MKSETQSHEPASTKTSWTPFLKTLSPALACVSIGGLLMGCSQTSSESQTQYALFPSANSSQFLGQMYTQLTQTPQVELCIGLVGFSATSPAQFNYPLLAERSLQRWFKAIRSVPAWSKRQTPSIVTRVQYKPCDITATQQPGKFGVTFFGTQRDFVANLCQDDSPARLKANGRMISPPLDPILCRQDIGYSIGTPGLPAIFMSPLRGYTARDPNMEASVMHEFGHSFGLADTYNARLTNNPNSGGVSYSGQMASALMRYSGGVEPYPDDLAGLDQVIRLSLNPGTRAECEGQTLAGTANYFFCAPSGTALAKLRTDHIQAENEVTKTVASAPAPAPEPTPATVSASKTGRESSGTEDVPRPETASVATSTKPLPTSASGTALQEVQSLAKETKPFRAILTFIHDTHLKTTAAQQAVDLPPADKCRILNGQASIEVMIIPSRSSLGHGYYTSPSPIDACPEAVAQQGYFFLGHVRIFK